MFAALDVVTSIFRTICPLLDTISVLEVIFPVALVLCAVGMGVDSVAMGLVVTPLALVLVSVHVPERTLAMSLVIPPVTLIPGSILPDLLSPAVSMLALPLTFVFCTIFENVLRSLFDAVQVVDVSILPSVRRGRRAIFCLPIRLFLRH